MSDDRAELLARLRLPFELDQIELLPKYTGRKEDKGKNRHRCEECGGYHDFPCVHLAYVGHAGVTMRLLDVDPEWSWAPVATNEDGTPRSTDGGLWIRLTVLGITRLGYGDAGEKKPPFTGAAMKELIGDAIRNAAMRFGVGTYLWSKSESARAELTRQGIEDDEPEPAPEPQPTPRERRASRRLIEEIRALRLELRVSDDVYAEQLEAVGHVSIDTDLTQAAATRLLAAYEERKAALTDTVAPVRAVEDEEEQS